MAKKRVCRRKGAISVNTIEVNHLSVSFPSARGPVQVLRDVSLSFAQGKITAVVGESGSGKSILGAGILRFLDSSARISGEILYKEKNLLSLKEEEMRRIWGREIGWIAQDPVTAMDPLIRVGKQVTEALRFFRKERRQELKTKAIHQLASYGLSDPVRTYGRYPHQLSGGMAQRVMAAMMTMDDPGFLIADEPTKGLDAFVRRQVADMFCSLRDQGTGIFLITHDLKLARRIADFTAVMYAGELLEFAPTEELFSHPLHPYTEGLLRAQPDGGFHPINGKPPDLSNLPEGCIFANRCPFFESGLCMSCQEAVVLAHGHRVKCAKRGSGR